MYEPRKCPKCGGSLDPGEVCDCDREPETPTLAEQAEAAAIAEAKAAYCKISLEKLAGSETFSRHIEASSGPVAVNGLAVLVKELAGLLGVDIMRVLSLLAVTLTVPAIQEDQGEVKA